MSLSVERVGQYDITPMSDGKYGVSLNNGNIGAFVTDAAGVEKIKKEYEQKTPEEKAKIEANVKTPLLERTPNEDKVSFSGNEESLDNSSSNKKKGILITLGLIAVAALAWVLTGGRLKSNSSKVEGLSEVVASELGDAGKPISEAIQKTSKAAEEAFGNIAASLQKSIDELFGGGVLKAQKAVEEMPKSQSAVIIPFRPKALEAEKAAEDVIENVASKCQKAVEEVLESKAPKASYTTDGYCGSEIPPANRGIYGQDLYDISEPMNKYDISSPYYEQPRYPSLLEYDYLEPFGYNVF